MLCTCAAAVSVIHIDYRHKYCAYICHKPWLCHKAKARILHLDHSSMMLKPLCKRIAGVPTRFGLFEKMPITMATRAIPYWFDVFGGSQDKIAQYPVSWDPPACFGMADRNTTLSMHCLQNKEVGNSIYAAMYTMIMKDA